MTIVGGSPAPTFLLDARDEPFATIVVARLDLDQAEPARELVVEANRSAARRAGCLGSVAFAAPDGSAVALYTHWRAESDHLTALLDETASGSLRALQGLARSLRVMSFVLKEVRGGPDRASAELSADPEAMSAIIVFTTQARAARDFLLQYNVMDTDRHTRSLDGFGLATFLAGSDPTTFAELVQWTSPAHFARAFADPGFAEHLPICHHWSTTEVHVLGVVDVAC